MDLKVFCESTAESAKGYGEEQMVKNELCLHRNWHLYIGEGAFILFKLGSSPKKVLTPNTVNGTIPPGQEKISEEGQESIAGNH